MEYFSSFLERSPIFKDKQILQANYIPEQIVHRDEQLAAVAQIIAPCLRNEKPSNIFIYGKTGTGKTLTIKYISNQLKKVISEKEKNVKIIYINCKLKKVADTEYRLIAQLIKEFGKTMPATGLPTDEIYSTFYQILDQEEQSVILILDEIDQLIGRAGDELLYNLTRINSELKKAQISIIGISNDISFTDNLDPRIKSSLSEEEIIFPPYNAVQLQEILRARSIKAFYPGAIEEGLIEKCAAYAAREHGDARRALELLRVASELAERDNSPKVQIKYLDEAEAKIEKDRVLEIIMMQPKQYQAIVYSIIQTCEKQKAQIFTGEVYEVYQELCRHVSLRPLTQRRVSDVIGELDMLGIIQAKVISKGRYGRTREILLATNEKINEKMKQALEEGLAIG